MQLKDLKPSVLNLSPDEALLIHREIRKSRMTFKPAKSEVKRKTIKKVTSAQKEIIKDPEKIKELLRLLGEEV